MHNFTDTYFEKLKKTFYDDLIKVKNPTILEFGVRQGVSTKMFIEICESNMGKLYSLDRGRWNRLRLIILPACFGLYFFSILLLYQTDYFNLIIIYRS